jgi:hypothetical protein
MAESSEWGVKNDDNVIFLCETRLVIRYLYTLNIFYVITCLILFMLYYQMWYLILTRLDVIVYDTSA